MGGPCPACGGSDRFRISRRGAFCRHCCPDGSDAAAVRRLLEAAGLDRRGQDSTPEPINHAALSAPAKPVEESNEQAEFLLKACQPPNQLVTDYLASRFCWPPASMRVPLPNNSVKWLPRAALTKAALKSMPDEAEGAMAFVRLNLRTRRAAALALVALDAAARRILWFGKVKSREVGKRKGTAFVSRPAKGAAETHIAEGEIDALALRWTQRGRCLSVGGTSGLLDAARSIPGTLTIHADGDADGAKFAEIARHKAGVPKVEFSAAGHDPASELAAIIEERAAIREFDGKLPRRDAEIAAWQDLFKDQIQQLRKAE